MSEQNSWTRAPSASGELQVPSDEDIFPSLWFKTTRSLQWKRNRFRLNRSELIYIIISLLIESLRFFSVTLPSSFIECFYLVYSKIGASCQKWVTQYPRWHSVDGAKPFIRISVHVGTVCNVQLMTGAKRRSVTCIMIHGMWTAAVELREFARVIGGVFQWKQERLWIILVLISTS